MWASNLMLLILYWHVREADKPYIGFAISFWYWDWGCGVAKCLLILSIKSWEKKNIPYRWRSFLHDVTAMSGEQRDSIPRGDMSTPHLCLLPDLSNPQPTPRPQNGWKKLKMVTKTGMESYIMQEKLVRTNKILPLVIFVIL